MRYLLIQIIVALCMLPGGASQAQSKKNIRTVIHSDTVKDYGPVLASIISDMLNQEGGVLQIGYGIYPVLTPITVENSNVVPEISIVGIKNKRGEYPILMDTSIKRNPHHFFLFTGYSAKPGMKINISSLEIIGNNVRYSKAHPFFDKIPGMVAILALNVISCHINNVLIKNCYGSGIVVANYFEHIYNRDYRAKSASVKNCKILNVWAWSKKMDSGDGIEFFSVTNPVVENNIILNNLKDTEFIGRGGIVLEHNVEKATIRNNHIGGYRSGVHAECDWGGHVIDKNTFTQSSIAVTLSEDCNQPDSLLKEFSPIIIKNNNISYKQELIKYNIPVGNFSFISVHRANPMLNGLTIINNNMTYSFDPKLTVIETNQKILNKDESIYIELKGLKNVTVKGNKFK